MKDFFISYNKADRAWAEWIAWQLEEAKYTVDIQAWDFLPGMNFILKMDEAAKDTQRTIAVSSPDYLTALYTKPEWAAAFAKDPTSKDKKLLPVRVRECDLDGLLGQVVYVDLVSLDETQAKNTLLAAAKGDRAKPENAPGFPPNAQRTIAQKPRFPGSLPDIWNIPHLRNPNFIGREEFLADLRMGLTSGKTVALTAIHGLGGVGKTQLALEYAYRFASEYNIVWWVQSEEPTALANDYGRLAEKLGLLQKGSNTIEQVKEWLRQNRGWLLIFDNAPKAASVRDYIPGANTGHVIVTSRSHSWKGIANPLPVKVLPIEKAIKFILNRTGQTDETAARSLAEALGCLPLALEQACAYIDATGSTIPHYLDLFHQNQQELLKRPDPSGINKETVAGTWNISFQQVEAESPAAAGLMKLFAFLAPEGIPRKLISEGKEFLPEELTLALAAPLALDDAILALQTYSLVEVSNEIFSVHRLIQAVTRFQMDEEAKKVWIESAVRMVNSAFPDNSNDVRTWDVCSPLLPHALTASSYAEGSKLAAEATVRLLNQAGYYLYGRAEFTQAKILCERALTISEISFEPNHLMMASQLNNLGLALKSLGNFAEARANYERALAISEAAFGPNHHKVATIASNLGCVLQGLGDQAGARANLERALAISEAAFGPDHPQVATIANNLGNILEELDDLAGAKANYERALAIDEAAFGFDHPDVAIDVNNLGSVLKSLGDLVGAKANYERALAIDEAAFGFDHPNVARDINNLGHVLKLLGDLAGARANHERALQIFRQFLGEDHPSTIRASNNLRILEGEINKASQKEDSP